jgi:carbonic anhydrase/acetyltransferase-like protein (isoleucine patch superfamily)
VILSFEGKTPRVADGVFVAPNATLIGDVEVGEGSSVWYQAVIRGDVFPIRIGRNVNIQDLTMIHVTTGMHATHIGDNVTVGHGAILHGCTLHDGAFVGMGAVVMDQAVLGEECIVGARSLVTVGTVIPPRTLAIGSPAKVIRELKDHELAMVRASAPHYKNLAERHIKALNTPT